MSQSDIFLANILTLIILRASTMGPCGSIIIFHSDAVDPVRLVF
jgi:hypothetical protein